ncbi:alpha/beta fold hydrolase [Paenibacillus sp. UMB4589-SE434]|uniref:alpha/beta fold hydrolase n=1 Tax=Paenibacillus sp. UMB4589-SE434 TaxID=3046314 RepID=UPI00254E7B29|nr:alpha/beta fold hydrolase [Paenibacillus sp. UMB4589-SE434]MDK8180788.1 alpha/beta fold hydrolase [Paenibacillus sp. UMB4589-SE434]
MQGIISKINGVSLWHIVQGQGIPIVLIHGGPGSYDYLEPVAELLDKSCFQIIRYEQRGSWRSEKTGPYDVETFIEDLEQLRIHLGVKNWIVCGHSWGASLALAYSTKYSSNVTALIYISGTGINPAWHADYRVNRLDRMSLGDREEYIYLRSIIETLRDEERDHTKDRIREISLRTDLNDQVNYDKLPRSDGPFVNNEVNQKVGAECNEYFENEKFKTTVILNSFPSLFVHGETDPRPYKYVRELAFNLQNSEFILIPNAGHYPWLDNPNAIGKSLNEFLTRINLYL